jgi:hypothetical protein
MNELVSFECLLNGFGGKIVYGGDGGFGWNESKKQKKGLNR